MWTLRACVVQGSQQIWIAALWFWGNTLNGVAQVTAPWYIVLILWPLALMSMIFAYLMLYGLPGMSSCCPISLSSVSCNLIEYYRQVPPKVPNFTRTLFRRKLVLWFLASEILRDYWLSGVSFRVRLSYLLFTNKSTSLTDVTGPSCGADRYQNGRH